MNFLNTQQAAAIDLRQWDNPWFLNNWIIINKRWTLARRFLRQIELSGKNDDVELHFKGGEKNKEREKKNEAAW